MEEFWCVRAANYEYGFYWHFGQDGAIQHEVKLTGEVSTTLASPEDAEDPRFGTLVLPNVLAAHHQHLFCARLDMAVDDEEGGRGLVVTEARSLFAPFSIYQRHFSIFPSTLAQAFQSCMDASPRGMTVSKVAQIMHLFLHLQDDRIAMNGDLACYC